MVHSQRTQVAQVTEVNVIPLCCTVPKQKHREGTVRTAKFNPKENVLISESMASYK